jgi:hypothetical protein
VRGLMGRFMPNVSGDGGGGGTHSLQCACASETFPGLRTLGQDLERGMRGLSGWALA